MNLLGKLVRNFLTNLLSLRVAPSDADFDEMSDIWVANSSIMMDYFIFKLSNSVIRVCSRAFLTLSLPR